MTAVVERTDQQFSGDETVHLTSAQALVRFLRAQHSERDGDRQRVIPAVFGIFGHGNVPNLAQALREESGLRFYQPKNEQSMVHTAIGYAKASNRLATFACTASIGPGSTNMLTGAATATTNRLPVLLLPADTFATRRQGPVLQQLEHPVEADVTVNDCFRPISRFFDRIARPEQLLTALPQAMRVLLDPAETGAVTIAIHQDVLGEAHDFPAAFFADRTWQVIRRPPADEEIENALALLRNAERPLLIAGGGVHYSSAYAELAAFAETLGIPVAETSAGKGSYPHGELLLGGIGVNGTRAANRLAAGADLVICVGTRLTDFTTASHSLFQHHDVRFVGVNVSASDATKLGAHSIVADAKLALAALHAESRQRPTGESYRGEIVEAVRAWHIDLDDDLAPRAGERMSQGQALRTLNRHTRRGDFTVAAAGSPPGDLLKIWDCENGALTHIEFGYSCMGHEISAALGIRLARPDTGEVFVVLGDGGYLMSPTELVTAAQLGLKLTVLLVVNGGYQSIHGLQEASTGGSFGNEFRHPDDTGTLAGPTVDVDYATSAKAFGCTVYEADSIESLNGALDAARARLNRPCVIVTTVEPRRGLLASGAWWDLGVAQSSGDPKTQELAREHSRRAANEQRFYY